MIIELTKQRDGSAVLRCIRGDGSVTWQKQEETNAAFFPFHDLTHYAVETELGFRHGFFGLIAEGWEIAETTGKTARGALPIEALEVEYLVSAFSAERVSRSAVTADDFNQLAATFADAKGMPEPRKLSDDDLAHVRSRFDALAGKWRAVPADETMRLSF